MRLQKTILSVVLILLSLTIQAQSLSNRQSRHMNEKLLSLLEQYSSYVVFTEPYMRTSFVDLFENGDGKVFCDYVAHESFSKQISAGKYSEYSSSFALIQSDISDVERGEYTFDGAKWRTTLCFVKNLAYIDELGVYFCGKNKLTLNCVYEKEWDSFKVESVSGECLDGQMPSGRFTVVEQASDIDNLLYTEEGKVEFNDFKQAIVASTSFSVSDDDIFFKKKVMGSTPRYDLLKFEYSIKHLRLKPRFSYAPFAYRVSGPEGLSSKSSAMEGGIDFGYVFPSKSPFKFGLNIGLGISSSSLDLSYGATSFDVPYYVKDPNTGAYSTMYRHYSVNSVSEGLSLMDVTVPAYMSFEYKVKRIAVVLDLGPKINLNISTKPKAYVMDASAYSSGAASESKAVSFLQPGYLFPGNYARNTYDISVFGDLGVDVSVSKTSAFSFKIGYEMGLTPCYASSELPWLNPSANIYPAIFRNGEDIMVRSFVDCISYYRNALSFSVGWKWKL